MKSVERESAAPPKPRPDCDHKCHKGLGLNEWVKSCPACGCPNPRFDGTESPKDFEELLQRIYEREGGR